MTTEQPITPFTAASMQVQLVACMKASHDIVTTLIKFHPGERQRLEAAMGAMQQFEAIVSTQIDGKTSFPPALKPLERAMNDVLRNCQDRLNHGVENPEDMDNALARLDEGQAAITQASIAGFTMLSHLARVLAAVSKPD